MAITQQWKINQLDCYPAEDGEVDVVFTAHWSLTAEDFFGGEPITGYVYGTQGLTHNAKEPFTPYSSLTEDQVLGWVKAAMGDETVLAHETAVVQQIEDQKNPPIVTPPLPWGKPKCVLLSAARIGHTNQAEIKFTAPYNNIFVTTVANGQTTETQVTPTESAGVFTATVFGGGVGTHTYSVYAQDDNGNKTLNSNTISVTFIV